MGGADVVVEQGTVALVGEESFGGGGARRRSFASVGE